MLKIDNPLKPVLLSNIINNYFMYQLTNLMYRVHTDITKYTPKEQLSPNHIWDLYYQIYWLNENNYDANELLDAEFIKLHKDMERNNIAKLYCSLYELYKYMVAYRPGILTYNNCKFSLQLRGFHNPKHVMEFNLIYKDEKYDGYLDWRHLFKDNPTSLNHPTIAPISYRQYVDHNFPEIDGLLINLALTHFADKETIDAYIDATPVENRKDSKSASSVKKVKKSTGDVDTVSAEA